MKFLETENVKNSSGNFKETKQILKKFTCLKFWKKF